MVGPPSRLILASASPARRDLLIRAGYSFEVVSTNIDETAQVAKDARSLVQQIAWLKAAAVAPSVEEGIVLAADTIGWLNGQAIGKPADEADARRILGSLSGTEHELWTGVCLWRRPDDVQVAWQELSMVAMKALTDTELDAYIATGRWQGCSGAYAILEEGDPYIRVARGSTTNVIGLPMETLAKVLKSG
jgi:septum formation protein